MRVLLVNDYEHKGGAEVVMQAQRKALASAGHAVEIFAGDRVGLRRTPWSYIDSSRARKELRSKLRAFDPDVVHLHNFYHLLSPGILAELERWTRPGRVVAMTVHDMHIVCPNPGMLRFKRNGDSVSADESAPIIARWDHRGWKHSFLRSLQHWWNYRLHQRQSVLDVLVTPSAWAESRMMRTGLPVRRVSNPIDIAPDVGIDRPSASQWTVAFAGRVEPEKGLDAILDELEGSGVRLVVIGDGSGLQRCQSKAKCLGVDADFYGWLSHHETIQAIRLADALVMPSVVHENAPLAIFEAISCRTVPIVSRVGGLPEIVEDFGVGRVFDSERAGSFRAALNHAQRSAPSDEQWRAAIEKLSLRTSKNYAASLEALYQEFGCGS